MAERNFRNIGQKAAIVLLFIDILSSFKLDLYFSSNFLFDAVAITVPATTFLICAFINSDRLPYMQSIMLLFIISLVMFVSGAVFEMHQNLSALISALTLRGWLYFLIVPAMAAMIRSGVEIKTMMNVVKLSLLICCMVMFVFSFAVDLEALKKSNDPEVTNLVRFDDLRGYRLSILHFATIATVMLGLTSLFSRQKSSILDPLMVIVGGVVLAMGFSRVLVGLAIASALIFFAFRNVRYSSILAVVGSLLIAGYMAICGVLLEYSLDANIVDSSAQARHLSLQRAEPIIAKYPFFGYGQAISSKLSYTDIFGAGFAPSDLGVTGVVFRFGYIGLVIYTAIAIWTFAGAWRFWDAARGVLGLGAATFPIMAIMMVLCSVSFPSFIAGDGFAIVVVTVGLSAFTRAQVEA
jgi:hypothetical protein